MLFPTILGHLIRKVTVARVPAWTFAVAVRKKGAASDNVHKSGSFAAEPFVINTQLFYPRSLVTEKLP